MLDKSGKIIYIGKAKNLKNRVNSYFNKQSKDNLKTKALVKHIDNIETILTKSENEAYILEHKLINKHKPKYNVIFKDDKSYPYILLTTNEKFPGLNYYRSKDDTKFSGKRFGPYPDALAVKNSLDLLYKIFKIRQCEKSFFANRTRPCLQYQIKRCSGPCVNLISKLEYKKNVSDVIACLSGKTDKVVQDLIIKMEKSSKEQKYEEAAKIRDQIKLLKVLQQEQRIVSQDIDKDLDVVAVAILGDNANIQLLQIRSGALQNSKQFKIKNKLTTEFNKESLLEKFLFQYYTAKNNNWPLEIIVATKLSKADSIAKYFKENFSKTIKIAFEVRSERLKLQQMAQKNAEQNLKQTDINYGNELLVAGFAELAEELKLTEPLDIIECFDISHTQGSQIVGACIAFNIEGPLKERYRRYNIEGIKKNDDYAAIKYTLEKHASSLQENNIKSASLYVIDGGKGQLQKAKEALQATGVTNAKLVSVAKGEGRKSGLETIYLDSNNKILTISPDSPAFKLLLRVRDESHRFALKSHRAKRAKQGYQSVLEKVDGIGKIRRKLLLNHFGGIQGLKAASIDDIIKISGISNELAERIFNALHK